MSAFVRRPNLPVRCGAVIIGKKYAEKLAKQLESLGFSCFFVPDNPYLDPRLSGHADLSVLHTGGEELLLAPYLKGSSLAESLAARGAALRFPDVRQSESYPNDAQFNVCFVGSHILYHEKVVPPKIVDILTKSDGKAVRCRQGYARCAVCVVDECSLITADRGIAAAASAAGISVLRISPGFVRLDGFPYGFLGGASFKLGKDVMAFTGRLDAHPDRGRIMDFLKERQIRPLYLTDEEIFDIGTAIPILEKE